MCTSSKTYYKYEIIEFKDQHDNFKMYLCVVKQNDQLVGTHFEAQNIEQAFAWLRLVMGTYPGTDFNDNNAIAS